MAQLKRYPQDLAREFLLSLDEVIQVLAPYFTVIDHNTPIPTGTYKLAKPALQRAQTLANLPLKFWGLKNFKGVRDSGVHFAPLTVIVGQNSAGKSSLIQSLLFFAQSQAVTGSSIPLNGPLYRAGLYRDILNNSCDAQSGSIEFYGRFTTTPLLRGGRFSDPYRINCDYQAVTGAAVGTSTYLSLGSVSLGITDSKGVESKLVVKAAEGNKPTEKSLQLFTDLDFDFAEADTAMLLVESDDKRGFTAELSTNHGLDNLKFESTSFEGMMPTACVGEFTPGEELALELVYPKGRISNLDESAQLFFHYLEETFGDLEGARNRGKHDSELLDVIQSIAIRMLDEDPRQGDRKSEMRDVSDRRTFRGLNLPLHQILAASIESALGAYTTDEEEIYWEEHAAEVNSLKSQLAQNLMAYVKSKSANESMFRHQRIVPLNRLLGREGYSAMTNFFGKRILYLGPLRKEPDFAYSQDAVTTPNTPLGMRGENTFWQLTTQLNSAEVHVAGDQGLTRVKLLDATNHWVQKFFGESATLRIGVQDQHGVAVKFGDQALPHVGVGVSQLLPVVVLCLMAKPGQIVLLEQPELHLHPALQQKLADFLLAMVDSGRQIVVETHSEYLITRLRLRTVQTSANADLFNIIFATNSPEDGTRYISTQVDRNGSLNTWPEGFFDEATSDLEEMMDIVLNREER